MFAETIADKERLIVSLMEQVAQARTLILSAPLHMPILDYNEARTSWMRDSQKWLDATQE